MLQQVAQIEIEIARQRKLLDTRLDTLYAGREHLRYHPEIDCTHAEWWDVIEKLVGSIFDNQLITKLGTDSLDSLLFFISRNEEFNAIIAWISPKAPLSHCGNLAYSDFLYLCEQALQREDDFCDYQLAASFEKLPSLDEAAVGILLRFFNKNLSYTRRRSLHALARFGRPETVDLAQRLWETDDCEFAKLSCLHSLKKIPDARDLFDMYLAEFERTHDIQGVDYLRAHMTQLRSDEGT